MAWPDFERRATITTGPALESFLEGIGLVESSSWNVKGKSFLDARTIDTGMGSPFISRANTNNVSVGDPLPGSLGEYGWAGNAGTLFWIDPKEELFAIYMVQVSDPDRIALRNQFRSMVQSAIID